MSKVDKSLLRARGLCEITSYPCSYTGILANQCRYGEYTSEDEYFDILYTGNLSRYVDVLETDIVELVPLASSTKLPIYIAVKPGDTSKITGDDAYDFSSIYRVHVSLHDSQWLTDQECGLKNILNSDIWLNDGKVGVGSITDQSGNVYENQLVAIGLNGTLAYSSDGKHWIRNGASLGGANWCAGLVYGNGIWCAVSENNTYGVKRSIDGGKSWSGTLANINACCLHFANDAFITATNTNPGSVYTSPDAENWTQVGSVKFTSGALRFLFCRDGKWICGSREGFVCQSENGKTWEEISSNLNQVRENKNGTCWLGGCYVNGYFYVIHDSGLVARSSNGIQWKKVFDFFTNNTNDSGGFTYYNNITYYKNKLWAFSRNGQKCDVGLLNPDGTIESLE